MDSFEARLQFIQVIKNLQKTLNITRTGTNDTSNSNSPNLANATGNDPIQFYLKNYQQHYEDFHQCLFDTASKMDPLDRLNVVLYYSRIIFVLHSKNSGFNSKVIYQHLLPSVARILLLALPVDDWKALTNLNACIEIFQSLNTLCDNLAQWDDEIPFVDVTTPIREIAWYNPGQSPSITYQESLQDALQLLKDRKGKRQYLFEYYTHHGICNLPSTSTTSTIIHRMENDREKHKRLKENIWVLERPSNNILDPQEFDSLWENTSSNSLTKEDYRNIKEMNRIAQCLPR